MAVKCRCGGELTPIKQVVNVKGDKMVKGQFWRCDKCHRLDLTSESWQRVAVITERDEPVKAGL